MESCHINESFCLNDFACFIRIEVGQSSNYVPFCQVLAEAPPGMESIMNESDELEELRRSFEMNLEREKAALEESVKRRQEEERRAEEAAERLRHQQEQLRRQEEEWKVKQQWNQQVRKEEQEARRLEEALRCKRAEEDMLQSQQKAKRMEAEEEVIRSRMGEYRVTIDICRLLY